MSRSTPTTPAGPAGPGLTTVAVVGVHGHGRTHVRTALLLEAQGLVRLAAVVDPTALDAADLDRIAADVVAHGPAGGLDVARVRERLAEVPWFEDLGAHLAAEPADVVVLSTPIHTHHELATQALRAGCDVLLEKPPTASLSEHDQLLATEQSTGHRVQVGFQTFGSGALPAMVALVAAGEIGEVTGVGTVGTWVRPLDYWDRATWAGRRVLGGRPVVDGVVTNPLAHAVATALYVAGARTVDDVADVTLDQFRANAIEADDTSVVRVTTTTGIPVTAALTLCAARHEAPLVTVTGTAGTLVLDYYADSVQVTGTSGTRTLTFPRTDLLSDLVTARTEPGRSLLSPLSGTGAFMRVLDAVRNAPDPAAIGSEHLAEVTDEVGTHLVVRDVEEWCRRAADEHATFTELGAPWTVRPVKTPPWDPQPQHREHGTLLAVTVGSTEVARYADGAGSPASDSPRPHLHPVRTRRGTLVTDAAPADHTWHLGLNVGVQDVAGSNLWGGRTFVEGQGYTWRRDHGRIEHVEWLRRQPGTVSHRLAWLDPAGQVLLDEVRELRWDVVGDDAWRLDLVTTLTVPAGHDEVALHSPGSHGRPQGGYGGIFWRLPACTDVDVRTALARGEDQVHGTVPADGAPWLAWSATPAGEVPVGGRARAGAQDFTLVVVAADARTAADPWFVRVDSYPGIGSALAWEKPLVVRPQAPERRALTVVVGDGRWSDERVASVVAAVVPTAVVPTAVVPTTAAGSREEDR